MYVLENHFCSFSTKTVVVGTRENRLNEMVLLSTQNMCKLMGKKMIFLLIWTNGIFIAFRNEFDKFNKRGLRMLDSILYIIMTF